MTLRTYCPKCGAEKPCLPVFRPCWCWCCQGSWREQGPGSNVDLHRHPIRVGTLVDGRPAEWVQSWCHRCNKFGLQPSYTGRGRALVGNFTTAQWLQKDQVSHLSGGKIVRLMCLSHILFPLKQVRSCLQFPPKTHIVCPVWRTGGTVRHRAPSRWQQSAQPLRSGGLSCASWYEPHSSLISLTEQEPLKRLLAS